MKHTNWVHTIIRAMHRLGDSAPYSRLKPEIENGGERMLTGKWHQTVEGTVEAFSSDSIRGHKPPSFRGSPKDVFRKVGHGHWAIRSMDNPYVKEALEDVIVEHPPAERRVFVHEHWRAWPGEGDTPPSSSLSIANLIVTNAWTTDEDVVLRFSNGLRTYSPLKWFPKLLAAPQSARARLEVHRGGVAWPELDLQILITDVFEGQGA